jgi:HTH-type transcriptional regulator / antitoxin HipB
MKINRTEDVGALVRDRRRALKLTQTQLALKLGVSQRYVSHLERGKSTLQLGLVLRVLHELGVSLLVDTGEGKKPEARNQRRPKISIDRLVDE